MYKSICVICLIKKKSCNKEQASQLQQPTSCRFTLFVQIKFCCWYGDLATQRSWQTKARITLGEDILLRCCAHIEQEKPIAAKGHTSRTALLWLRNFNKVLISSFCCSDKLSVYLVTSWENILKYSNVQADQMAVLQDARHNHRHC